MLFLHLPWQWTRGSPKLKIENNVSAGKIMAILWSHSSEILKEYSTHVFLHRLLQRKLEDRGIRNKRNRMQIFVSILQDDAHLHVAAHTFATLQKLNLIPHPLYNLDLVPSPLWFSNRLFRSSYARNQKISSWVTSASFRTDGASVLQTQGLC